jgi:hypothetical protein
MVESQYARNSERSGTVKNKRKPKSFSLEDCHPVMMRSWAEYEHRAKLEAGCVAFVRRLARVPCHIYSEEPQGQCNPIDTGCWPCQARRLVAKFKKGSKA